MSSTDTPLTPVPFADRTTSPLWESLIPKAQCSRCLAWQPYDQYEQVPSWQQRHYQVCATCAERGRRAA